MGRIGYGYGSEWHLLRYLGYHRDQLNEEVRSAVGEDDSVQVLWEDFDFRSPGGPLRDDAEYQGLDFLPVGTPARIAWTTYWPRRGQQPSWDAVARLLRDGHEPEWLLVEAKAHRAELRAYARITSGFQARRSV